MSPTPKPNTIISPRRLLAVAAVGGALVVAGCGSDDREEVAESKPAAPPAAKESRAGETLRVTETDFAIESAKDRIEPGAVTITVTNRGQAPHALAIETPDGVVQSPMMGAGESSEVEAELDAGTYTWYCPVGDHRARGMEGELTVGSGGDGSGEARDEAGADQPPARGYGY